MSLPMTQDPYRLDAKELEALEAPLIILTQRCGGDLRKLLFAFFSFLNRRTDFYVLQSEQDEGGKSMGFNEGDAEKLLLAAFRQFPLRRIPTSPALTPTVNQTSSTTSKTTLSAEEKVSSTKESKTQPKPVATSGEDTVHLTEEGLQVPVGNGGTSKSYKWTQTVDECSVLIGIPDDLRAKDLSVTIKTSEISVRAKKPLEGETEARCFVEGPLCQTIIPSESTWTLESGVLVLVLYKQKKTFWESVIQGDEKIDTTLVDSRRHIDEYDDVTQAQIRKIIYDQNQARRGLPTSTDILNAEKGIPPLPPGVEYIDQQILDEKTKNAGEPSEK